MIELTRWEAPMAECNEFDEKVEKLLPCVYGCEPDKGIHVFGWCPKGYRRAVAAELRAQAELAGKQIGDVIRRMSHDAATEIDQLEALRDADCKEIADLRADIERYIQRDCDRLTEIDQLKAQLAEAERREAELKAVL